MKFYFGHKMVEYNKNKHLISLHIAKTGGTSFGSILKEWFQDSFHFHYVDEEDFKFPSTVNLKHYFFNKRNICIHGHFEKDRGMDVFNLYPSSKQFITFLRKPIELQQSMFFFQKKLISKQGGVFYNKKRYLKVLYEDIVTGRMMETNDIDVFLSNARAPILRQLCFHLDFDNYKTVFENNFIHIGDFSNYSNSVKVIAKKLKKSVPNEIPELNKSSYNYIPSAEIVHKFDKNHKLENEIYDYIKKLNEKGF